MMVKAIIPLFRRMRLKIIFPAIFLASLVLGLAIFLHQRKDSSVANPVSSVSSAASEVASPPAPAPTQKKSLAYAVQHDPITASSASDESEAENQAHAEAVAQKAAQLSELGMSGDPASLRTILGSLTDPDPDVRKAAVDAAVQFNSPDAIPSLQNAMQSTDDVEEKASIKKAIDFLQLPPL